MRVCPVFYGVHWLHITRFHFTNQYWATELDRESGKHPESYTAHTDKDDDVS